MRRKIEMDDSGVFKEGPSEVLIGVIALLLEIRCLVDGQFEIGGKQLSPVAARSERRLGLDPGSREKGKKSQEDLDTGLSPA